MPVDRLTQIRHNWQEKGNGPRGRDVDFLLGVVDGHRGERELMRQCLKAEKFDAQYENSRLPGDSALSGLFNSFEEVLARFPATESAQPEEER